MTIKSKKNVVWLCLFIAISLGVGIYAHNKAIEKRRQDLLDKICAVREERRAYNASAMREAGVNACIADGAENLPQEQVSYVCDLIRAQYGKTVQVSDVATWIDEPGVKLLLTDDTMYLYSPEVGNVLYWDLKQMDVSAVEWERKKHGAIFIDGKSYHFLEDCRKPFTDAIRRVIVNCKTHCEDQTLQQELDSIGR